MYVVNAAFTTCHAAPRWPTKSITSNTGIFLGVKQSATNTINTNLIPSVKAAGYCCRNSFMFDYDTAVPSCSLTSNNLLSEAEGQ